MFLQYILSKNLIVVDNILSIEYDMQVSAKAIVKFNFTGRKFTSSAANM